MTDKRFDGELSLREIQMATLEILDAIDAVCKQEGIRYFLTYGTLIGAVRHQGFIPWDDDLDIAMPRSDYERFLSCFPELLPDDSPLVVINRRTNERAPFLITRISDTRYRMIGESGLDVSEMGTFVDVYPLDGMGDDIEQAKSMLVRCNKLMKGFCRADNSKCNTRGFGTIKRALSVVRAQAMKSPSAYLDDLRKVVLAYDFDSSRYCAMAVWDGTIIDKREDWGSASMSFEGRQLPVPSGYDSLLRAWYGNYMQLPPEPERVGHHVYKIYRRE